MLPSQAVGCKLKFKKLTDAQIVKFTRRGMLRYDGAGGGGAGGGGAGGGGASKNRKVPAQPLNVPGGLPVPSASSVAGRAATSRGGVALSG